VDALFATILDLKARGVSTLFVSHKLEEVFEISEHFTILRSGEVVADCPPSELDRRKFSFFMTGREFADTRFEPGPVAPQPVLEARHLGLRNGFSDVSFALHAGEILGITGLLGSGRTELAKTLFGAHKADSGELLVSGQPVKFDSVRRAVAHGVGYVPEDRITEGLFLDRSIADNIVIAEIDASLTRAGLLDRAKKRAEAAHWVDALKIATNDPENAANTLSGGNQQRIVVAKWLATKPSVLILNGPTVGVDIGSKHDIHQILRQLAADGIGVIVISDDIPEIVQNCSRILLMRAGRIERELDPAQTDEAELARLMTAEEAVA
jgi:simple sugar transport system ATP-binding protein